MPEPHGVGERIVIADKAPQLQRAITLGAVLLPFAGLIAAIVLVWASPFSWVYLALFGGFTIATLVGVGVGFHRLFTHRSFQTGSVIRFVLGALGSIAVEGPLLKWVAVHRMHHQHTDVVGDPHSPHVGAMESGPGWRPFLHGLWHAHIGWLFEKDPPEMNRYVGDLLKDPVCRFIDRTFVLWSVLGFVIPAVLGGVLTMTWSGVLLGFLWGGLVRVLFVHHVTWSINSVCHLWGSRPFETGDESRDNPILGLLTFGEGWHNAHHAFPTSARHGLAWWKLDVNYLVIRVLAMFRLARNVRLPSAERISDKRRLRSPETVH